MSAGAQIKSAATELLGLDWSDPDALERVAEYCRRWLSADGVSLFVNVDGTDTYALAAQSGCAARLPFSTSFRKGKSIAGRVAACGQPALLSGALGSDEVSSALVVPLVSPQGACVGVINVSRLGASPSFTREDLALANSIAGPVSLAVSNSLLALRLTASAERQSQLADLLENLFESVGSGILVLDEGGTVIRTNSAARKLLNIDSSFSWGDENANPEIDRFIRRLLLEQGGELSLEIEGRQLHVLVTRTASGIIAAIDDITSHVEREREFARSKRLAEIGQMTAAVAHEFRNPLTSVHGAAEMILGETEVQAAKEWARVVMSEAKTLESLCDEFLQFARPFVPALAPEKLSDICREAVELEALSTPDANIHFSGAAKSPTIYADRARLIQALRNLIRNACEATENDGDVWVRLSHSASKARIVIEDNGKGMSPEAMSKLFTPFFTTKPRGTGLGLANVQKIVEGHGGRVLANSELGKGTTFIIELSAKES